MLIFWNTIYYLLKLFTNILFAFQIVILVLVFFTAGYCLFDLAGFSTFNFVEPLASVISEYIRMFYTKDIVLDGTFVDSSLLAFDIMGIIFIFIISKFKYYINLTNESVKNKIEEQHQKIENNFNKKLQKEFNKEINAKNRVAILIRIEMKDLNIDSIWGKKAETSPKEKEEEAFKTYYNTVKNIEGCKFAKTGDKMLILLDDISKFDDFLSNTYNIMQRIKENMYKKKWSFLSYISTAVYSDSENFRESIYPYMEKLLNLKEKENAICLGYFQLRYTQQESKQSFSFLKKGVFEISGESEVWLIVKKY